MASCDRAYDQSYGAMIDRTIIRSIARPIVRSIVTTYDRSYDQSWHQTIYNRRLEVLNMTTTLLRLILHWRSPTTSATSRMFFLRFAHDSNMFRSQVGRNLVVSPGVWDFSDNSTRMCYSLLVSVCLGRLATASERSSNISTTKIAYLNPGNLTFVVSDIVTYKES